jgi:hypothetical protein
MFCLILGYALILNMNVDWVPETNLLVEKKEELQPVYLPTSIVLSLQKEFGVTNDEIARSIQMIIQKAIEERIAEKNSNVFTEAETRELEEDLKGLGYI